MARSHPHLLFALLLPCLLATSFLEAQGVDYIRLEPLPGDPLLDVDVGMVRITGSGLFYPTENFAAHGWSAGADGIPQDGGGDDVDLGPVSATWSWIPVEIPPIYGNPPPSVFGTIDPATGVFTAGIGPETCRGEVTATFPGVDPVSTEIYVLPPDWVPDPPLSVYAVTCESNGPDVTLTWRNGAVYDALLILRDQVVIATLPGSAAGHLDAAVAAGAHTYAVTGVVGTEPSPPRSCIAAVEVSEPVQLIWVPPQGTADGADTDAALSAAFTALGVPHASVTGLYGHDLSRFGTVWCSVGSFLSHHVLRPWEGRRLADHVAAGGSVYLEGGDIWTQPDPITELHAISGIAGLSPFSGTITSVAGTGQAGCDMAPFSAGYSGNSFQVDRIGPTGPDAWTIWLRNSSSDGIGVFSRPPGTGGKIIGTSWFLGGYDGDMTSLVEQYLSCLAPPGPGSDFIRSDVNGDGAFNLVDPIQVLTYLFVNGDLSCLDAADFSDDDALNIADPVGILTFLFAAGPPPPPPYPDCGADPEGTALDCGDGGCP